jgi:hypothetical protein
VSKQLSPLEKMGFPFGLRAMISPSSRCCFPKTRIEMEGTMRWYFFVAYFFGGAFLVNSRICVAPSQAPRWRGLD